MDSNGKRNVDTHTRGEPEMQKGEKKLEEKK